MTHTSAKAVRGGLLAAALLVACATPAQASVREPEPRSDNWLLLKVTRGDTHAGPARGSLLLCDPPQGHKRAADACAELDAAGGAIDRIPPKDVYCPMVYAPLTAHAHGEWQGRPVTYTQNFSNACLMAARTGSVFALDT